jgi:hypothetical protein
VSCGRRHGLRDRVNGAVRRAGHERCHKVAATGFLSVPRPEHVLWSRSVRPLTGVRCRTAAVLFELVVPAAFVQLPLQCGKVNILLSVTVISVSLRRIGATMRFRAKRRCHKAAVRVRFKLGLASLSGLVKPLTGVRGRTALLAI